jgi:hypothetical protein
VNRDLAFGTAGVVVAAGYYWLAVSIPDSALADEVGPQGLPIVYAIVLLCLSLILVVRSLRTIQLAGLARRSPAALGTPEPDARIQDPHRPFHLTRVAGMLAIGVAYIVLVPWLGYAVTLAGLIFVATWYQGGGASRTTALVAVAGAIVFWLLFVALLGIPQPPGIWAQRF